MISACRKAEEQGLGSIQVEGQLIDAASVRIFQNVLDRAEIGKRGG
jgi:citrate lyase subunit beta / citryl-CoA lyase